MTSIRIGQVILNQYRVDEFIAAGGMGAVYKVWDIRHRIYLAMKVLHSELKEDTSIYRRFYREAQVLSNLKHPNIVPCYGLYEFDDNICLMQEYIEGQTVKKLLQSQHGNRLQLQDTLAIVNAVSGALDYVHRHGIIHCDVKPANVIVRKDGAVYVMDFGIIRYASRSTVTFPFAGSPAYMTPEQIRGEPVSPRSDIYSLGIMTYEMLTGRRPFTLDDPTIKSLGGIGREKYYTAHLSIIPPKPSYFVPELPPGVDQVLLKALEKVPAQRYQSTKEFCRQLNRIFNYSIHDNTGEGQIAAEREIKVQQDIMIDDNRVKQKPPTYLHQRLSPPLNKGIRSRIIPLGLIIGTIFLIGYILVMGLRGNNSIFPHNVILQPVCQLSF